MRMQLWKKLQVLKFDEGLHNISLKARNIHKTLIFLNIPFWFVLIFEIACNRLAWMHTNKFQ